MGLKERTAAKRSTEAIRYRSAIRRNGEEYFKPSCAIWYWKVEIST
jgi:hypothetical protein